MSDNLSSDRIDIIESAKTPTNGEQKVIKDEFKQAIDETINTVCSVITKTTNSRSNSRESRTQKPVIKAE
ncbi:hypothetical protein WR25_23379 [Diploscapter pachys]|uniref:Uncharacterized protein n=1 Tax=Diploscapter pachys TaxID=2018661 RepID=A0A2A2KCF2_9BILA|nr:hypothetical protein WR25_23379 [Diploscapter pachys]